MIATAGPSPAIPNLEASAPNQGYSHVAEEAGGYLARVHLRFLPNLRRRSTVEDDLDLIIQLQAQRKRRCRCDRFNPRQGLEFSEQPGIEIGDSLEIRVVGERKPQVEGQHPVRVEAGVGTGEFGETANKQARSNDENDRQREFGDDERGAEVSAAGAGRRAASPVVERILEIRPAQTNCRRQSKEKTGQHGCCESEQEHLWIDRKLSEPPKLGRAENGQASDQPVGESQANDRPDRCQHDALGEQLSRDPPSTGAQGSSQSDFATPRGRSCEQEVGHVRTGDQEQDSRSAEEDQDCRAEIPHHRILERSRRDSVAAVRAGILLLQPVGDDSHFPPRRFHGRTGSHAAEDVEDSHTPGKHLVVDADGEPYQRRSREVEPRRRHADHGDRAAFHRHGLSDDVGIAAEPVLPERVPDDDDALPVGGSVLGRECTPQNRRDAKDVEVIRRDSVSEDLHRVALVVHHRQVVFCVSCQILDHRAGFDEIPHVGRRHHVALDAPLLVGRPHPDQFIGLRVGEWVQEDGIDDAEDGRRRANPEGQGQGRDDAETGIAPDGPEGETDIVKKKIH